MMDAVICSGCINFIQAFDYGRWGPDPGMAVASCISLYFISRYFISALSETDHDFRPGLHLSRARSCLKIEMNSQNISCGRLYPKSEMTLQNITDIDHYQDPVLSIL